MASAFTEPRPLAEGRDLAAEYRRAFDDTSRTPAERSAALHGIFRAAWGATTTPQPLNDPPAPTLDETMAALRDCTTRLVARFGLQEHSAHRCKHGINLERARCCSCAPLTPEDMEPQS